MTDPIEVMASAMFESSPAFLDSEQRITWDYLPRYGSELQEYWLLNAKAAIAALEAEGWRLIKPGKETPSIAYGFNNYGDKK